MKKVLTVLLILAMAISLVACATGPSNQTPATGTTPGTTTGTTPAPSTGGDEKIYIGAMTYMTGMNQILGEYLTPAFELARDEINAAGGLLGKQVEIELVDQGEDQQAVINATMKLLNNDKLCAIVGPNSSANTTAVLDTLKEHEILYMANGSSPAIKDAKIPTVYQIRMTDDLGGAILVDAMVKQYNLKKPAIMYMNDSFGEGLAIAARDHLKNEYGIEAATFLSFDPINERNFSPLFTQVLNSDADSLIAIGGQLQGSVIMQQAYNVEFPFPKFCNSSMMSADSIVQAGNEAAEGWMSIADWSTELDTEEAQHFVKSYEEKTGKLPNVYAVYAYDAMQVVFEAIRSGNSAERKDILEAMKNLKEFPVSMSTMTYRENHSLADSMLFVEIKDGVPVVNDFIPRPVK